MQTFLLISIRFCHFPSPRTHSNTPTTVFFFSVKVRIVLDPLPFAVLVQVQRGCLLLSKGQRQKVRSTRIGSSENDRCVNPPVLVHAYNPFLHPFHIFHLVSCAQAQKQHLLTDKEEVLLTTNLTDNVNRTFIKEEENTSFHASGQPSSAFKQRGEEL